MTGWPETSLSFVGAVDAARDPGVLESEPPDKISVRCWSLEGPSCLGNRLDAREWDGGFVGVDRDALTASRFPDVDVTSSIFRDDGTLADFSCVV